ncbi:hypothetical protein EUTSA_v10012034mg [Eutrema salsugineum]|uniref:Uncharacterized protein n=1 Tax=Eutrema salsugineum TaxID=72664 RepID=V4KFJ8_EUTSA|nr:hypothetical protein EUTSA_v10012034mg [Eutrema salsugineum]
MESFVGPTFPLDSLTLFFHSIHLNLFYVCSLSYIFPCFSNSVLVFYLSKLFDILKISLMGSLSLIDT